MEALKRTLKMTELKRRKGNLLHSTNPFLSSISIEKKVRRITNNCGDVMLVGTGEVITPVGFWHAEEVDSHKFIKLYINGVKAFKGLTGAGVRVFEVLYLEVQKNISKDKVYMSFSTVDQSITPMSEATYTRGMRELVDKGFIAASPHIGIFWLNPDYMWNGDRLAFVKEYRRKPTGTEQSKKKSSLDSDQLFLPNVILEEN